MSSYVVYLLVLALVTAAIPAHAQTASTDDHAKEASAQIAADSEIDVPEAAQPAVALVEAFAEALAAADFEQVEAMLDPNVIVLESGGVESSRSEYLSHHARSDAEFLARAERILLQRRARIDGDTAWIASESELHANKDGKSLVLLSTETMVLGNTASGWKIVHIHWSSRRKTPAAEGT